MKKGERMWAVLNPRGGVYFASFSDTRRTAILDHVNCLRSNGLDATWAKCRARGDRAVRVRVEILSEV